MAESKELQGKPRMNDDSAVPPPENTYSYRPSLLGAPHEFRLGEHGLAWNVGRRSGSVAWRDIDRVRLSFRPASMQSHRFLAEIWAAGAPKLTIMSTSWKSMVVQERLDEGYAAFVTELHRRLAQAQTQARFEQGTSPLQYWPGLVVFGGVSLALALLDRARLAAARDRRRPVHRRISRALSLARRRFFPPQPPAALPRRGAAGRAAAEGVSRYCRTTSTEHLA